MINKSVKKSAPKILKALWGSQKTPLVIGDLKIPCYVLEDGTRVLSGRGVQHALGFDKNVPGGMLGKLLNSPRLTPYLFPVKNKLNQQIQFALHNSGGIAPVAYGYEATLLVDICHALIEAHKAGTLTAHQTTYAEHAEVILKAVSKVGIIALIDEATGYQDVRKQDALKVIAEAYLSKERSAWEKCFPDEFYHQLFRLRGWTWSIAKKPMKVGQLTKDLVYKRLAPGIVAELEFINPCRKKWKRKACHHQYLNDTLGHPALSQHLHALTVLMRSSPNWKTFYKMVQMALPVKDDAFDL
jgi:hypothetical protein